MTTADFRIAPKARVHIRFRATEESYSFARGHPPYLIASLLASPPLTVWVMLWKSLGEKKLPVSEKIVGGNNQAAELRHNIPSNNKAQGEFRANLNTAVHFFQELIHSYAHAPWHTCMHARTHIL